jgi:hypothetical protein
MQHVTKQQHIPNRAHVHKWNMATSQPTALSVLSLGHRPPTCVPVTIAAAVPLCVSMFQLQLHSRKVQEQVAARDTQTQLDEPLYTICVRLSATSFSQCTFRLVLCSTFVPTLPSTPTVSVVEGSRGGGGISGAREVGATRSSSIH